MVCVFFALTIQVGPMDPPISPFIGVASTADLETDNEIAWLTLN